MLKFTISTISMLVGAFLIGSITGTGDAWRGFFAFMAFIALWISVAYLLDD